MNEQKLIDKSRLIERLVSGANTRRLSGLPLVTQGDTLLIEEHNYERYNYDSTNVSRNQEQVKSIS